VKFGEKDKKRDFNIRNGEWVKFKVEKDRRDKISREKSIELIDE
jgi:hypothetical protein